MNKTKKVAISAGHNYFVANNFDPGAVSGSLRECDIVKATAKLLVPMLEKRGYEVLDVTPYNERFSSTKAAHTEKCRRVDEFNADLYMDIHINSFSSPTATGTEAIVYSTKSNSYPYATQIVKNISNNTGIRNRGVKINTSFYALTLTRKPAMIIEGAFISNPNDMKNFTPEIYAKSIAEAFVDISVKVEIPDTDVTNTIYRVRKEWLDAKTQKGAFGNLEYAINKVLEVGNEYKVFDENGIQVYPDNVHWAKKHYDSLIDKGYKITDTDFDKEFTLGNAYKLFDELTDDMDIHDELEDEVEKEPEKEIEVVEILQLEYKRALQHKMKGEDVRKLQIALIELGYDPKGVDGSFGNGCLTAVKSFQRDNGLVVDGSFGLGSHNKINELLRRKGNNQPIPNPQIREQILRPDRQTTIVKLPFDIIDEVDVAVADTKNGRMTMAQFQNKFNFDFSINLALFWNHNGVSKPLNLLIDEYRQVYEGVYSRWGLRTFKDKSFNFDWYKWSPDLKDMIGGSPSLIINGKKHIDTGSMSGSLITARHPRSAIGADEKNFYMITVDGRNISKGHYGMTINELANLGLELGLTSFLNNDGGGSVRMLKGTQVLNSPTENRAVQSILGIKLK